MLATGFFVGVMVTHYARHRLQVPPPLTFLSIAIPVALTYLWYYYDAIEYSYVRSRALNMGIILLAVAFVPYYLARSRPRGRRLKAIWWMLGFASCYFIVELLGALFARLLGA